MAEISGPCKRVDSSAIFLIQSFVYFLRIFFYQEKNSLKML